MSRTLLLLKQARVSSIPDDWRISQIGESCSIRNDLRKPISVEERSSLKGDYPYYGPTGILDYIDEYLVDGEFALIGEDGDHFLKPEEKSQTIFATGKFNVNNHAHVIASTKDCSALWFAAFFKHRNITDFLSRQGANRYKLNKATLEKLPILLPPQPEQKAIANLLSNWDEAIKKTERLIQAKEKQLRQMSRWLLFGHKRLGNQKIEFADGHFFKYPSDWGLVKIGKVAKEVSARNGESEETVLSCSKYDGFVNSLDYFGKQVFSSDTSNYKVVKKGQFGYPSNHVEEGSIGLLEHCEKGIVSPIYVVFEASKEKVHSPYLYKLLKTDIYRHIFQVSTSSSVDRRGSLRWSDFSKIKVLLPSLEEQKQISETLSSAQHEIDLLKQLEDKYKTQKRGLMQKMLTGEWRIKPEVVKNFEEAR
jgi:type I restriction enzyme S subunit